MLAQSRERDEIVYLSVSNSFYVKLRRFILHEQAVSETLRQQRYCHKSNDDLWSNQLFVQLVSLAIRKW